MTDAQSYQRFLAELKRRRVFRVMAVYGIVGFVLLQIVDLVVPALLLPAWTYRLVALILLLGLPVAVVLAWALEVTPEGVRRAGEAAPGELTEILDAPASTRWSAGSLALVAVAALLVGAWYVGRQSAPSSSEGPAVGAAPSIAVLPFADMSPDRDQEYFSDGIAEELLNLLTKIPELQVAARTSSFSFKGQNLEIPEIAARLNVAHVLEGSVRKADDRVRVTAQLIRADDGFHVWSETWDRTLDDIFAIQDEIAAGVVAQLRVTLLGAAPTAEETDPEAYALFLQARQLSNQATPESLARANELYRQVVDTDPAYAAGWVELARSYSWLGRIGLRPAGESHAQARDAAQRALALDPNRAEAHSHLGWIALVYENDLAGAAMHYERSVALAPTNPEVLSRAANLARSLGRMDVAIALGEYSAVRDPMNPSIHIRLGVAYRDAGRIDAAIKSLRTALTMSPAFHGLQGAIGTALLLKDEPEAALAAFAEEGDEEYRIRGTAMAMYALGRQAEFESTFLELRERWGGESPSEVALVYAWTGDADAAFEWLDRAVAQSESGLAGEFQQPFYSSLHDDSRWQALRARTGNSEEQLAAIEFDVRLPQ